MALVEVCPPGAVDSEIQVRRHISCATSVHLPKIGRNESAEVGKRDELTRMNPPGFIGWSYWMRLLFHTYPTNLTISSA